MIDASIVSKSRPGAPRPIYVGNPAHAQAVLAASRGMPKVAARAVRIIIRSVLCGTATFLSGFVVLIAGARNQSPNAMYAGAAVITAGILGMVLGLLLARSPWLHRAFTEFLGLLEHGIIVEVHQETIKGLGDVSEIGPNVTAADIFAMYFAEIYAARDLAEALDAPEVPNSLPVVQALRAALRVVGEKIRVREIAARQAERADALDQAARHSIYIAELIARQP